MCVREGEREGEEECVFWNVMTYRRQVLPEVSNLLLYFTTVPVVCCSGVLQKCVAAVCCSRVQ